MENEYKESLLRIRYVSKKQDNIFSLLTVSPNRSLILESLNDILNQYDTKYRDISDKHLQTKMDQLRHIISKSILNSPDEKYNHNVHLKNGFTLVGLLERLLSYISFLDHNPISMQSSQTLYHSYIDVINFINDNMKV